MENDIFWSEIGSGFEEPGGTPQQEFPGVPPGILKHFKSFRKHTETAHHESRQMFKTCSDLD